MLASVHVADVGARSALAFVRRTPKPAEVDGLRHANVALGAPLSRSTRSSARIRLPKRSQVVGGSDSSRSARTGRGPGCRATSRPHASRSTTAPAAVLTLGRLRLSQTARFLRTSAKAEGRAVEAPGMIWATGLARPPFVSTCSLWASTKALSTYAFGRAEPAHADAIAEGEAKEFHHQSAFVRFRPYGSEGQLDGTNPLAENWMAATARAEEES